MIFGGFLKTIGDETFGTTMTNAVFNFVLSGTGLVSNHMLQHYSCRKVGLAGAVIFFIGAFGTCYVNSLIQLIITWGVLQGFGLGLMMPACFTSFNGYFNKKQTFMMSGAQTLIAVIAMGYPFMIEKFNERFTWRETQFVVAGLSLHCFVAMISLQPVKWHMKKKYLEPNEAVLNSGHSHLEVPQVRSGNVSPRSLRENEQPLLSHAGHEALMGHLVNRLERRRPSIIGVGSLAASITSMDNVGHDDDPKKSLWMKIYDNFDLGLFKDPVFLNISFGMALCLTADIAFLSLFPMILSNAKFSGENVTLIMTVYFAADLAGRIFVSVLSACMHVRNRYLVLAGALFSAIFRIAFVSYDSFLWVLIISAILGFLRSLIQIPLPLVIGEVYGERFSTAFTLYMVVCAVVAAIFGPLLPYVKDVTGSDIMVVHLLTFAYLTCTIPWIIELCYERINN
ncbi:monocarboxylate transporter 1-like, partial [Atheta coriaria]|uniref:monocarboxylate transporter 1-like n=1 Tax=Dalotia coriaria TaxID=877792 RepID=UPI0031F4217D